MGKTVAELSQEFGVTPQYLNRILKENKIGNKIGNKNIVSETEEMLLKTIIERKSKKKSKTKTETKSETSFVFVSERQLLQKDKEIDKLHQLLDQAQQLLLNEQKKNQLLLESKSENDLSDWKEEKNRLESQVQLLQETSQLARQEVNQKQAKLERNSHLLSILAVVILVFFLLLLFLVWLYLNR